MKLSILVRPSLNPATTIPILSSRWLRRWPGEVERGIAVCGSGVGASVCANKVAGVRAALVHDHFSAHQGVEDDHMNVLCMGGRIVGPQWHGTSFRDSWEPGSATANDTYAAWLKSPRWRQEEPSQGSLENFE